MKPVVFILMLVVQAGFAQQPQFRGPDRNGIFPETGLLKKWPEGGPELLFKVQDLGGGYSSPIYRDGIIYITGKKGDHDYLNAIDNNGKILYSVPYGSAWYETYPESRCTPTLDNGKLYVVSGVGDVVCLDANDGRQIWSVNAHEKYEGELHRWGIAESPLVVDDKVLYTTGGGNTSLVAFDKLTGKEIWKAKSLGGPRAFVSPVLFQSGKVRRIIAVTANHVIGIIPDDGSIAFQYQYLPDQATSQRGATNNTNSPVIRGNQLFISKGYDQYGVMLEISTDGNSVKELWRSSILDTHHGHYVYHGDYLFGSNWTSNAVGKWVCLEWKTGKVMYEEEWITKGSIVLADDLLYCYEERSGKVALVRPIPDHFDIVSTITISEGTGPHWAHPYIAGGKLFIRHGEVLMVFNIKA